VSGDGRRLRDAGLVPDCLHPPGPWNAITDVAGVAVGHAAVVGEDPGACTGVTAILPRAGGPALAPVAAAVWALNGAGECTGGLLVNEWGVLQTPIFLTGTPSVGRVYDAALDWLMARSERLASGRGWAIPCVAECFDGWLNDARRHRAGAAEVAAALAAASTGPVAEGGVGGGRGMIAFDLKGGIGTASRLATGTPWRVGALVNCNHGAREELTIAGVRVGPALRGVPPARGAGSDGSVIAVLATDAPLGHRGLRRLCKRGALGLGRAGASAQHGSGDILIAFSTAGPDPAGQVPPQELAGLFQAAAESVEEAVWNAVWAGEDTVGRQGRTVHGLPRDAALEVLRSRRPDLFARG
jgi:D-aminopeptidase